MLIKAPACNTANDLGNPGPDYLYGFGSLERSRRRGMSGSRSVCDEHRGHFHRRACDKNLPGTCRDAAGTCHAVLARLSGCPFSASALVNNLDLTVKDASGTVHYPLILNPAAGHVQDAAVEGVDNLNNIEQVVVNLPAGGTFQISVAGTSVPAGPQPFVITWQVIQPSVKWSRRTATRSIYPAKSISSGGTHMEESPIHSKQNIRPTMAPPGRWSRTISLQISAS
ncbi:hypothetical protein ACQ86N_14610 [Puia sp. P3]|uniref:hypothetical protein n=1 Tax=Puia sp. P3 TaxID=3423952 RepID=UPI003D666292